MKLMYFLFLRKNILLSKFFRLIDSSTPSLLCHLLKICMCSIEAVDAGVATISQATCAKFRKMAFSFNHCTKIVHQNNLVIVPKLLTKYNLVLVIILNCLVI